MLHPLTKRVGVFVNAGYDHILETIEKYKLDMVQLHSEEPPEICRSLQEHAGIIKAFGIGSASDFCRIADYEGACDLYVFDTKTPAYGGSGRKFDHRLLSFYKGQTPYLLSGGISVDDMSSGLNNYDKLCIGFDINSRFETSPGVKDPELIKTFLELIKNKDNEQDR